jgi:short-subunit dehydrogenase
MGKSRKTAIVTVASSGIVEHFARMLAARGYDVVVAARRLDRLEALAKDIEGKHDVKVTPIKLDLGVSGAAEALFAETEGAGMEVEVLINNAGFGTQGYFPEIPWAKTAEQIQLNVVSLTEATYRFVGAMRERRKGYVLNVASIGAYMPVPGYATYAAGKAYVRNFSEALDHELRGSGVRVCCLCPGPTETEFIAVAGQSIPAWQKIAFMSAERCARIGMRALFGGRRLIVAGLLNTLTMLSLRWTPRRVITFFAAVFMEGPRPKLP